MARFRAEDYYPKEYSAPKEEYVFEINKQKFHGFTYVDDRSHPFFQILDVGDNFISTLRDYYHKYNGIDLPATKLFVIDNANVNAFAVFEKELNSYCIGIFSGICNRLECNIRSSLDKVCGVLFPEEEYDEWCDHVYTCALRFFVAHEYSHIICGHVNKEEKTLYLEFESMTNMNQNNLYSHMKEFQADQMAASFLCSLTYLDTETQHNVRIGNYRQMEEDFWRDEFPDIPLYYKEVLLKKKRDQYIAESLRKMTLYRHERLKAIMAGINIVFFTLDENRVRSLERWADYNHITDGERNTFFFKSGLSTMKIFDHPLPPIRLDAVIRIVDEAIEKFERKDVVDQLQIDVSAFAWVVEIHRNNFDLGALYCHIAHTPTGQDYIQEMESLWQAKKDSFNSYLPPLVRLFYENRIVDMSDDGELVS